MRHRGGGGGMGAIALMSLFIWSLMQLVAAAFYLLGMLARIVFLVLIPLLVWAVATLFNAGAAALQPLRYKGPGRTRTALAGAVVAVAGMLEILAHGFDGLGRALGRRRFHYRRW